MSGVKEQMLWEEGVVTIKRPQCKIKDSCSDGDVLNPDCINVNTLVVILYYSVVRCYHWGKPFFLTTEMKYNYLKIKKVY